MARMIPEDIAEYDPKSGEDRIYNALKDKLSDDYYVFHSRSFIDVTGNKRRDCEIDFIIAHPEKGLLFIEAKNGGNIQYRDGQWRYGNGGLMSHGGPYKQVLRANTILRDKKEDYNECRNIDWEYRSAVWFLGMDRKDVEGRNFPPEADVRITLFRDDLNDPLPRIEEIYNIEHDGRRINLNEQDFNTLINNFLCPVFRAVPSLKYQRDNLNYLLSDQCRLLDFLEYQRTAVINGAAGTGKTMIACERARRLGAQGQRVLFLCYNRFLCDDLAQRTSDRGDFRTVEFYTLDGYACKCMRMGDAGEAEKRMPAYLETITPTDFDYDHVIIDEGQDFAESPVKVEIVNKLEQLMERKEFGSFYLFYDSNQTVQGRINGGHAQVRFPNCIEHPTCLLTLFVNCRNTIEIATTSSVMLRDDNGKPIVPKVRRQGEPNDAIRPTFSFSENNNMVTQLGEILKRLAADNIKAKDTVILTVGTEENSSLRGRYRPGENGNFSIYDHNGENYRFTSCRKFKGLEADAVVIIDLNPDLIQRMSDRWKMEFYVGASRAKLKLACLFTCQNDRASYERLLGQINPDARYDGGNHGACRRLRRMIGSELKASIKEAV